MLYITGMGYAHPDVELDNQFIEDLDIGTSEEWILDKIGIKKRLTTLPLNYIAETRNANPHNAIEIASVSLTDLGIEASKMAIEKAGIKAEDLGLVICNCAAQDQTAPSVAQRIAKGLDISPLAYDVNTACPAVALHIDYLRNFKEEALPDHILCISTAAITQHVNYNDRSDSAIWGDGAAAWIVSPRKEGRLKVVDSFYTSDPLRCESVVVNVFGHFAQDGRVVRDFSVRQTVRLIKKIEKEYDIDWNRDVFIGHQANQTMLRQITNNRKIPPENHWHNVTEIGNQAGAGAPAVLAMHWDQIKSGQKVVIAVVGAGLSWGSVLMEAV